jgi:hypothetical protein
MLHVSWLGGVLENFLLVAVKFSRLVVFLVLQRPADTVTNGNNNNKHHDQKLTF